MAESAGATDKGTGLSVLFGALALIGAVMMYVGAPGQLAAWGFAAVVTFGAILVAVVQIYG